MPRYIDAEKARELIINYGKGAINDNRKRLDPVDDILLLARGIDLIPTADVAPVVRCKDCKWWKGNCESGACVQLGFAIRDADEYCSRGERR